MSTPAGWYDDPNQPGQQQYWDGNAWTGQMQPAPSAAVAAPPPAPAYGAPPANPYAPPANPYGGPPPIGGYPGGQQLTYGQPLPPGVNAPLAGYGSRVGAYLLDGLLSVVTIFILVIVNWFLMGREGEHNGQTLGKQIVGIRVVRADGQPCTAGTGFLRDFVVRGLLFGTIGFFLFGIPGLLDLLWPLWDKPGQQTLTDKIVSTYVVTA